MIPQTLFTISSILTNGFRTIDAPPQLTATTLLRPLLHAVSWLYASLLLEDLANQRLPGSVAEDAFNKPWRPVPAGRITPDEARRAALYLVPALMVFGGWSGVFRETAAFVAFVWMYNDLDAADTSIYWRNVTNGLGLAALSAGATVVASGGLEYSPPERAVVWIFVTGLVVSNVMGDNVRHDYTKKKVTGRFAMVEVAAIFCALISSLVMGSYKVKGRAFDLFKESSSESSPGTHIQGATGEGFWEPSPMILFMAMIVYGVATSTLYQINREDKYQDVALAVGVTTGVIYEELSGDSILATLLHIFPWSILLTLSVSRIGHRFCRCKLG
ncbi:UbiA prenyltransferase [Colletotrichum karsti]|uniref:UbiA prenyltransferase n=1 Tax=Colletotrichum karsti TaxID=1095194 RepID=A0A9P6LHE7_9PEZI|nr:UbiA prenyltransferase [Colletotrichum karsti]KAF9876194.1 UbiA prenyltransferase [Colletotrichum karsti]